MRNCNVEFLAWRNKLTLAGVLVVVGGSLNLFTLLSYVSSSFFVAGQEKGIAGFLASNFLLFYLIGIVACFLVVTFGIYVMVTADRLLTDERDMTKHFEKSFIFILGLVFSIITLSPIAIVGSIIIFIARKHVLSNPEKFNGYTDEFKTKKKELGDLIASSKSMRTIDSLTIPGVYDPSERMVFLDFLRNLKLAGALFMIGGGVQLLIAFLNFSYLFPKNNNFQSTMYMVAAVVSIIFGKIILSYAERISGMPQNIVILFKRPWPFLVIIGLAIITSAPITIVGAAFLLISHYTLADNLSVFVNIEAEQAAMNQAKVPTSPND